MHNHPVRQDLLQADYTYRRLHGQHQEIEHAIENLKSTPFGDEVELKRLKQIKLRLKDSMHFIEESATH